MRICLFVPDVSWISSSSSTPLPKCAKEQMRSLLRQHARRGGVIRRRNLWLLMMDDFNSGNGFDNESDHLAIAIKVSHASLECKFCPLLPSPFILHELQSHSLPVRIFRSKSCRLHQFAIFRCHQKWIGFISSVVGDRVFCFEIRWKLNLVKYELMTKM